jgi:hypothetical protein
MFYVSKSAVIVILYVIMQVPRLIIYMLYFVSMQIHHYYYQCYCYYYYFYCYYELKG